MLQFFLQSWRKLLHNFSLTSDLFLLVDEMNSAVKRRRVADAMAGKADEQWMNREMKMKKLCFCVKGMETKYDCWMR